MVIMGSGLAGDIVIEANHLSDTVNYSSTLGSNIIKGVGDMGSTIGTAIGIAVALAALFGVVYAIWTFVANLLGKARNLKSA